MPQLHIGQVTVPYEIEWSSDRSTIGIAMEPTKELTVTAPLSATIDEAKDVLEDRKPWILEKLQALDDQAGPPAKKEFLSGEKFFYNGRRYRLRVKQEEGQEPQLEFGDQRFLLKLPNGLDEEGRTSLGRKLFRGWYEEKAREEFPARVKKFARQLDVEPDGVQIHDSIREWGQHQGRTIKLHWRLVMAPKRIQDYVIVHELAHFENPRHEEGFWNRVGAVLPDYEERREWLRVKGNQLHL